MIGDTGVDGFSDAGSTPASSTKTGQIKLLIWYIYIGVYLLGVLTRIKITALYIDKVIYSAVIFMIFLLMVSICISLLLR